MNERESRNIWEMAWQVECLLYKNKDGVWISDSPYKYLLDRIVHKQYQPSEADMRDCQGKLATLAKSGSCGFK